MRGCRRVRGGRNGWSTEDSEGSDTPPCGTVLVHTCRYAFVQTHRMSSTTMTLMETENAG